MRTILFGGFLVLGALGALAARAHAELNDEVSVGRGTRALRSASANALTDDNLGGAAFGYGRKIAVLGPDLSVWGEGGLAIDTARGTMFQALSTQLDVVDLTAGLRVRYALGRWLAGSGRLAAGAQHVDVEIADGRGPATDDAWGALGSAAVAVDLIVPMSPAFRLGVRAELGYTVAQAPSVTPRRDDGDGDALLLPMTTAALGDLDLSGPSFGVLLFGQF